MTLNDGTTPVIPNENMPASVTTVPVDGRIGNADGSAAAQSSDMATHSPSNRREATVISTGFRSRGTGQCRYAGFARQRISGECRSHWTRLRVFGAGAARHNGTDHGPGADPMTISEARTRELRRLVAVGVLLGVADHLLDTTPWLLFAGACVYLGWHVYNVHLLAGWLARGGREPGLDTRGIWAHVFEALGRIHRQNRKRKKRLRKAVNRVRQAAEAMPDGAIVLDGAGIILWMNEASGRLLGLERARDIGRSVSHIIRHPDFTAALEAEAFDEPFHIVSPLHEEIHVLIRIVPYGGSRRLMLVRDVSRLYYLEQMRKDFVANVSHELRSPLTVITGYLETFQDDEHLPAGFRRPVSRMSQQASRMCLIVEDLLRLSRLEAAPGGAPAEQIDVAEMLRMIVRDARALSESAHRISHEADLELALLGDWNELYSAFSNIVFNAVQYTPAGGMIRLEWASDGEGARLDVSDTGEGIEAHHIPRLTERFYRVDKARSHEKGGTGLGLAIVKHVLVRHDARLEIESRSSEGSRFSCRFPAHRTAYSSASAELKRAVAG